MNHLSHRLSGALLLLLASIAPLAQGAEITWSLPTDISGDTDVSTNGSVIGAFNIKTRPLPATTVNGVTFQTFVVADGSMSATMGNFTFNSATGFLVRDDNAASPDMPFSSLSADYQALLAGFVSGFSSPFTLTISGLTIGMQYEFQWWSNFSTEGASWRTTATAGKTVMLNTNPTGTDGGLGQFALGSFTADATTQVITFNNLDFISIVNGFQLRQTSVASVPEGGSTFALLALALGGLVIGRETIRRRQRI